ncbi:MAG: T9SS type A sorting domain-containing protein [bacterium]|nr:T9SS type A sorting domain-containing protein [bacterium]
MTLLKRITCISILIAAQTASAGGVRMHQHALSRSWQAIELPQGSTQKEMVENFLFQNRQLLGQAEDSEAVFKLDGITEIAAGQRYLYSYQVHGLPIFETQLVLLVKGEKVLTLFNTPPEKIIRASVPALTAAQALSIAERALKNTQFRRSPQIELGYTPGGRLVYRVKLPGLDPPADWEVWVNAGNGEVLKQVDRRLFIDGTGRIFNPDPKTATGLTNLTDQNDANSAIPEAAYSMVILPLLYPSVGGNYYLDGPFVSTALTNNRAGEVTPDFDYLRADDRFEEVMVYYHINRQQVYFQDTLLTPNANNRQQVCNVNGTPDDNSWFSPFDHSITYGYGGVDDAEDADVIIHEYGHAVQDDVCPNWYGGHTGAMGEGFGDFLAGVYSLAVNPTFQPNWVFNWDGHNEFWGGRILNAPYHYPENANGEVHDSGQLWSAGLMDVWWEMSDRIAWERIVLQHHFLLGAGATMADAAEAILATESTLYGGIYRQIIVDHFNQRGFINSANYYPAIVSAPLPDSEDTLQTTFVITAVITSATPLDINSFQLFWRADQNPYQSIQLEPTGSPSEYYGNIPGPFSGNLISYYLTAADTFGLASMLPDSAPSQPFQFYVGPDPYPPHVVWVDSLGPTVFTTLTKPVRALVTDNLGIETVELFWRTVPEEWQSLPMQTASQDTFTGALTYSNQDFNQTIEYFVHAVDASSRHNSINSSIKSFPITTSISLEDFEGPLGFWSFNGQWGLTSQFAHSGSNAIEDSPNQPYQPNSNSWAQWGESWDLSNLTRISITFWEMTLLEDGHDWGYFEVSADEGPWQILYQVTGVEANWHQREVLLDDFCGGVCHSLRFRFRTQTDQGGNLLGWCVDDLGVFTEVIVPVTPVTQPAKLPDHYALSSPAPNPFNAQTIIHFDLPVSSSVTMNVYNSRGQLVSSILDNYLEAGEHQVTWYGDNLSSGIYFCQMQAGSFKAIRKVVLLK